MAVPPGLASPAAEFPAPGPQPPPTAPDPRPPGPAGLARRGFPAREDRTLHGSPKTGPRRHGRGLAGPRPQPGPRRGDQDAAGPLCRQGRSPEAVSPRGPAGGQAAPHQCGDRLLGRPGGQPGLYRHGVRGRAVAGQRGERRPADALARGHAGDPRRGRRPRMRPTSWAWCTATSSRPTSCGPATA